MGLPTSSDSHVNAVLTNISVAHMQDPANFVADVVFPNIPVNKESDRYYVYNRGDFNRDEMQLRAPGTESAGGGYRLDNTPNYFADTYSFHKDIPDHVRRNSDSVLAPDREATLFVSNKALIKREVLWVSKYFVTGVWTGDDDGVTGTPGSNQFLRWDDDASTPIKDIRTRSTDMAVSSGGFRPNVLVLGRRVFDALVDHPDIVDRVKYGQTPGNPADVDTTDLALLFKIGRVVVMDAIQNTAKEAAAEVGAFIGGKHALLAYAAPNPGLMTPSAGYTFSWKGMDPGAGNQGQAITQFRMQHLKSDRVEIDMAVDQKVVDADSGFFMENAVS